MDPVGVPFQDSGDLGAARGGERKVEEEPSSSFFSSAEEEKRRDDKRRMDMADGGAARAMDVEVEIRD